MLPSRSPCFGYMWQRYREIVARYCRAWTGPVVSARLITGETTCSWLDCNIVQWVLHSLLRIKHTGVLDLVGCISHASLLPLVSGGFAEAELQGHLAFFTDCTFVLAVVFLSDADRISL